MKIIYFIFFIFLQIVWGERISDEEIKALMQVNKSCKCGMVPIYNDQPERIINGEEAVEHEFPWMAALILNGDVHQCGGSLINDRYVLTAAHCFGSFVVEDLTVVLGLHSYSLLKEQGTAYKAEKIIIHGSYRNWTIGTVPIEDIALIKLKNLVQYSPSIQPICLPLSRESPEGKESTVAGWGLLGIKETKMSDKLMKTKLTVWTEKQCKQYKVIGPLIEKNMLCAYGVRTGTYHGDSGGPLVWNTSSRFEEIGIVSWGHAYSIEYPDVYTRVTDYLEWILSHTKDAVYCIDPAF